MTEEEIERFRQLILKMKHDLLSQLGYLKTTHDRTMEALSSSVNTDDHVLETIESEATHNLAHREKRYLYHLNEALERISDGTYGICRTCGEEITKLRLEAVPHTAQCIRCKRKEEKKRRGL